MARRLWWRASNRSVLRVGGMGVRSACEAPDRTDISSEDLATTQRLGDVLARHDNVLAVLVGHAHTMATTTFAGVPVLVGGGLISTVTTVTTDAEDMPSIDYTRPPTIALHLVQDDHLVIHWRVV